MSEFYSILTTKGLEKVAALADIHLTHMVFGNSTNAPNENQTELGSEKHRCELIKVAVVNNQIIAEATILGNVGGFWVREIGIIDSDGDLFAVGKYPATYKPISDEGSVKELGVRMIIAVVNTDAIVIYNMGIVDGAANTNLDNLTFAGQKKFNDKADLESPGLFGIPTTPTAEVGTNTEQIANTAFVQMAIAGLINSAPGVLDTLKELAAALGDDPNFADTIMTMLADKVDSETFEAFETTISNLLGEKATSESVEELTTAITESLAGKVTKTGDAMSGALSAHNEDPTVAFNVRNIKAQTVDPGAESELTTGCVLLIYE